MNPRIGWGQPPATWQAPGWAPLVDPGPRSLQVTRSLGRWWWPILVVGGFLAAVVHVFNHHHSPSGLSPRGLLTVALAAVVAILLTIHRRHGPGPLARAVAEYTVVALLAGLLATTGVGVDQPADDQTVSGQTRTQAAAGDDQPAVIRAVTKALGAGVKVARAIAGAARWLVDLWHRADQQATAKGEAMATPPHSPTSTSFAPSIWRSHA